MSGRVRVGAALPRLLRGHSPGLRVGTSVPAVLELAGVGGAGRGSHGPGRVEASRPAGRAEAAAAAAGGGERAEAAAAVGGARRAEAARAAGAVGGTG